MPSDIHPGDEAVHVKTVQSNKLEPSTVLWPRLTIYVYDVIFI